MGVEQKSGIILAVDDSKRNLRLITKILESSQYMVLQAMNGATALKVVEQAIPDLILLDIGMPDMDGYEVCRQLKSNDTLKDIPVVFLSGLTNQEGKLKAFQSGGVDYIEKPVQKQELLARVKTHIQLYKIQFSLETIVKERTKELEKANKTLKEEIEQRKKTEKKLSVSKTRYQFLYNNTPVMMHSIDKEGCLISVNYHWLKKLGYERDEVIGRKFIDFLTDLSKKVAVETILPVFYEKDEVENVEYQMKTKSGEVLSVLLSEILEKDDDGNEYSLAHLVDITQKKRSKREKRSLEARLNQAQKMEAIGTLACGIAHDFNNILSSIFGYAELAKIVSKEGGDVIKEIDEIMNAGYRARELIKHILLFSRKADILKKPLPLIPLLKETIKFIRAGLPPIITITSQIRVSASTIMADSVEMHQVIMNLCTNAAQAMKENGGHLDILLDEVEVREKSAARVQDVTPGIYYELTVKDTGHGISKEHMDKIFDPFFTTRAREEGTGLGLSIVHGIITEMNGCIHVFSEPGKGTQIKILLPKLDLETTEIVTEFFDIEKGSGQILFVDDEKHILKSNSKILQRFGYDVVTKTNPIEALNLFRKEKDFFDLVVTDFFMPDMSGIDLAEKIKEINHEIPIILCTGFSIGLTKEVLEKIGICEMVMKPLIAKELLDVINRAL